MNSGNIRGPSKNEPRSAHVIATRSELMMYKSPGVGLGK
jgi:hypothetical protein